MSGPAGPWGAGRDWNTWDPAAPACYLHRPSGLAVRVAAFSTASGRATEFPLGETVQFGEHATDGSAATLTLHHDGNHLRLTFAGQGSAGMTGAVEIERTGEWGLRFWYLLAVGFAGARGAPVTLQVPAGPARYLQPPVAVGRVGATHMAFRPDVRPVTADLYDDRHRPIQEMEQRGYYYRPPRAQRGRWAVYRFNATERRVGFAIGLGADPRQAQERLEDLSHASAPMPAPPPTVGWQRAVADVVGWNTVWDPDNARPYTVSTRNWVTDRFGGWIVWQVDTFLHALLAAHAGDLPLARANADCALDCATDSGCLAALRSPLTDWVDRSHPPLGAHTAWILFQRSGDDAILAGAHPVLARAWQWWAATRDGNGNGLLEYGSSPVGDGHFVHTKLAAMDESANDNSPVHDEADFDLSTHTLNMEDVGLNALLVHEAELLARMADHLGRPEEAAQMRARAETLAGLVRERLWDPRRRVFANRLWSGRFARSLSPTSFFPMVAGLATPEQAAALVHEHLLDPERFGGPHPVAGTPHDDPAAADNVYWRGRVWPYFNYLVYQGLRRYRFDDEATGLAQAGAVMFERAWQERRCYENLDQRTGEAGGSADAEPFYTWGALLAMIADIDLIGVDPWDGISFGRRQPGRAGLWTAQGHWVVEVGEGGVRLALDDAALVQTPQRVRFRDLLLGPAGSLRLRLPAGGPMVLTARQPTPAVTVTLDGHRLPHAIAAPPPAPGAWIRVEVPARLAEQTLT
ncbi:MAG TPA: trehalase family glycosidase, partial [Candidatus Dormibacteraeota bacterium]|nr:trehalase family glycosidase [Candidatus Dormibacteraeota bacterium]